MTEKTACFVSCVLGVAIISSSVDPSGWFLFGSFCYNFLNVIWSVRLMKKYPYCIV